MIAAASGFSGRRPIAICVLALVVSVLGYFSWGQLSVDLLPDLQNPVILVSVDSGDRPSEQMERLYGERLERQLFTIPGIRAIEQTVRNGRLISRVIFDWDTDPDFALVDVNKAVSSISADPDVDEVRVRQFDTRQLPVMTMGLTIKNQMELSDLRRLAERRIATSLEQLDGVAQVRVSGGRVKQIEVELDPVRMRAFDITVDLIQSRIRSSNVDFNAGTLEQDDKILLVRGKSRLLSSRDVERIVVRYITLPDGGIRAIRLEDIATVIINDAEINNLVRVNGAEGVGLFIYKEAGANTVSVSQTIRSAIVAIERDLPGVVFETITDEAVLIEDAIKEVQTALFLGIALSVTVLIFFLRSPAPIVMVVLAVPVSLLATTYAMSLAGYNFNLMTLGGLALGTGMLVDNAIVVIESIFRQRAQGASPMDSATRGTAIVGGAIFASTITTCVVFLPVLFIDGMAARLVSGIAFTVVVSLLASLFVAIFLIPALSTSMMQRDDTRLIDPGSKRLEILVLSILKRPGRILLVFSLALVFAIAGLSSLGTDLVPPSDPKQFSLRIATTPGQRIESTSVNIDNVEAILHAAAGSNIVAVLSEVGVLDNDDRVIREEYSAENTAQITVQLQDEGLTATGLFELANPMLESLYGTDIEWLLGASSLSQSLGEQNSGLEIDLVGRSLDELRTSAEKVKAVLTETDAFWNVQTSFEGAATELHIDLDRKLADGLGVNEDRIAPFIEASLDGLRATTLVLGDETRDVLLTLPQINRHNILSATLQTEDGKLLSIGDFARVIEVPGAFEIYRKEQQRVATVTANIKANHSVPETRTMAQDILANLALPLGVSAQFSESDGQRKQTLVELSWAGFLAVALVFMVLSASFESFRLPLVIISAIPMAIIGVAIVLVPLGKPVGVMAMLGFVVLAGLVVNDAILLAQAAKNQIDSGQEINTALAKAVSLRLRPIVMTTTTTVCSLIPLAITAGEAAQLRSPLAWTVIGGIIMSTVGCLFVVPCVYLVLDRLRFRTTDKFEAIPKNA